jgi:hypothetical protein
VTRADGGKIAVDLEICTQHTLRADNPWGFVEIFHARKADLWVLRERRILREVRGGFRMMGDPRSVQARIGHHHRVLSKAETRAKFREAELPAPPELARADSATPQQDKATHLPARLELILGVFDDHGLGPFRWRRIAELSGLHANPQLRSDLSALRRLEYLDNDGRGYTRTNKPYPMS